MIRLSSRPCMMEKIRSMGPILTKKMQLNCPIPVNKVKARSMSLIRRGTTLTLRTCPTVLSSRTTTATILRLRILTSEAFCRVQDWIDTILLWNLSTDLTLHLQMSHLGTRSCQETRLFSSNHDLKVATCAKQSRSGSLNMNCSSKTITALQATVSGSSSEFKTQGKARHTHFISPITWSLRAPTIKECDLWHTLWKMLPTPT